MNRPERLIPDAEWMPVVARAIERLDLMGTALANDDLMEIALSLKALFATPKCRNCGQPLDVTKSYYGQGAVFCSLTCREECLSA